MITSRATVAANLAAMSTAEQKMSALVASSSTLVRELSQCYTLMKLAKSEITFVKARENFMARLEELTTLMAVADEQMNEAMRPSFRSVTLERIFNLRHEILDICFGFLIERIKRIRLHALEIMKQESLPNGFSRVLGQGLETVLNAMSFMGKLDNLPPFQQQLISETRDTVVRLSVIEGKLDVWKQQTVNDNPAS